MIQQDRQLRAHTYLTEIAHALAMTEAVEVILPLIVDRIDILYGSEATALVGLLPERQEFTLLATSQSNRRLIAAESQIFPRSGTLLDRAFSERAPLAITPLGPGALDPLVQALIGNVRPETGYVFPLRVAGAERGGLILVNPRESLDTGEDIRTLLSLGDLAAVAIDRRRLRRIRSDGATRLKVLNAVLQVTSGGLDEETLIRRTLEALVSASPADRLELVTIEGSDLRRRYLHGPTTIGVNSHMQLIREELHRRVIAGEGPLMERESWSKEGGLEGYLACVPLQTPDQILGSLLIGRHTSEYDNQELELFRAVGGHLGTAIGLSRLVRRQATDAEALERALAESAMALQEIQGRLTGAEEELAHIQSLASLGELAAGVAHDLNNALNPVVAFAELIQEHSTQPEKVQMYADRILLAARGGAETVRRIQRFTRRRLATPAFESISVSSLISDAIELMRPSWSKRPLDAQITVENSQEPDLMVQGNAGELRQALLNLIGNALDAMSNGGTLRFNARGDDDEVIISVQDTGTGMSRAVFDRALEPFFTTKGAHGTGLGLAEVFGIARRHGGTLELESAEGAGTTVIMRLPRTWVAPAPTKERRRLETAARKLHQILLVDDSLLSLEATAASLRAAGHSVATAPNGQVALRIFNAGHYDLVLSDLGLPDMHGLELVDRLRDLNPEVRVGVITGWTIPEGDEELRRRGIDLLFVKPVDPDQLLMAL
jgi:signal transduction histidine kinase